MPVRSDAVPGVRAAAADCGRGDRLAKNRLREVGRNRFGIYSNSALFDALARSRKAKPSQCGLQPYEAGVMREIFVPSMLTPAISPC